MTRLVSKMERMTIISLSSWARRFLKKGLRDRGRGGQVRGGNWKERFCELLLPILTEENSTR